jgi:hypothetical protein
MLAPQDLMTKDIEELRQLVLDRKEEKKEKASKPSKKERRQKQEQQERAAERAERQQQEKAERREQEKAAKEQAQAQDSDRAEPMEEDGNGPLDITNVRAWPPPACLRCAAWPGAAWLALPPGSWKRRRRAGCWGAAGRRAGASHRLPRTAQRAHSPHARPAAPPPGDHLCGPRIRGVHLRLEPHRAAAGLRVSRRPHRCCLPRPPAPPLAAGSLSCSRLLRLQRPRCPLPRPSASSSPASSPPLLRSSGDATARIWNVAMGEGQVPQVGPPAQPPSRCHPEALGLEPAP